MQNFLLRHCREQSRLAEKQIAVKAGLTIKRYQALEACEALMTDTESKVLGKLFNIQPHYLWQSSAQLDQLQNAFELLHLQKERINNLTIGI